MIGLIWIEEDWEDYMSSYLNFNMRRFNLLTEQTKIVETSASQENIGACAEPI